jgi:hypothetical protein
MNIVRVVYESGIQAALQDGRWRLASCDFDPPVTFGTLPAATSGLRLRPILITEILTNRRERTFLLDATAKDLIALRISTFTGLGSTGSEIFHFHHLSYLLGAVAYHCERLAQLYAEICHEFVRVRFPDTSETNFVTFEYQPDPYYEFDALVTAARRTYDYSRYLLWQAFGDGSSSVPRSLAATLPCCNHMPPQLRERIDASWKQYGELLTDYRDCLQHYVPLDFGMASASMYRLPCRAWAMTLRIPDNPGVRSKRLFTYALQRDVLTYGYEVTNELLHVMQALGDAVGSKPRDA